MTRVAILWHHHQPSYQDLITHEHILPWVRLHALKDYYGMAALLREFPDVRVTFNLVPSLLVQLEEFAEGRAHDRFLDLSLKPATELTDGDAAFIVENFFHAQRQRMIDPYPRYAELLSLRGPVARPNGDARAIVRRFSVDDFRDLQVWHKLAWIDPEYLAGDARVRGLIAKGRHYNEADKGLLREVELELLNRVIPEYRHAAATGQVELSTSPFYHPILPLLCDTDVYLKTHPHSRLPRHRFVRPEDAAEQLHRAIACHKRLFGAEPAGVWPSEGSVSDAVVPIVARSGFRWMATDEQILGRTLGLSFTRDAGGHLEQPDRLYAPYRVRAGGETIACAFRDRVLSDLIGFTYASWHPEAAADDFVRRLVEAGRRYTAQTNGGEAFIPIILDGENAWEHYADGGRPFLRALYSRLSHHPELRTVTMGEGCARPSHEVTGIFPGSWIDANFYIWIGHRDDQQAWSQLAEARDALESAGPGVDPKALALAREEVLVAEGSDWFWWYGDDHSSAHDLEFDELFRRHLRNVHRLLNRPAPDELFLSNITTGAATPDQTEPSALIHPRLDGDETSYFEWLGAGSVEVREAAGAMHRTDEQPRILTLVRFGFDRECLYVRLDATRSVADWLLDGFEFSLKFLRPDNIRFSVRQEAGRVTGRFWHRLPAAPHWVERGPGGARLAAGTILEIAVPLEDLGVTAGDRVAFIVAVFDRTDVERERHPSYRPVEIEVPDEWFEARHWTV